MTPWVTQLVSAAHGSAAGGGANGVQSAFALANGTGCLAILTCGQLRTFNWPGVWQSQAAYLPHGPAAGVGVDHFLCVDAVGDET